MKEIEQNENVGCGCGAAVAIAGVVTMAMGYGLAIGVSLVVIGIIWGLWEMSQAQKKKEQQENRLKEEQKYFERHDQRASRLFELRESQKTANHVSLSVEMSTDSDEYAYSIKGINFCNVDDSMLGDFAGTARALKSNPHDPYAIGIYRGSKHVGFLPRGNQELHKRITVLGGSVDADGYIAKAKEDGKTFYYGKVNLFGV